MGQLTKVSSWGYEGEKLICTSFKIEVESVRKVLLAQEDSDNDEKITVADKGPKSFRLRTLDHAPDFDIEGTYCLSTLLQELTLHARRGERIAILQGALIAENPVDRTRRRIEQEFWQSLTRRMDQSLIKIVANDPKDYGDDPRPRIYVPHALTEQLAYYQNLANQYPGLRLEVLRLPPVSEHADMVRIRKTPGILALEMEKHDGILRGLQYIVPGGRFNEFYYWDSHFTAIGLLEAGRLDLVEDIVRQMIFQMKYYGCILNANRSYYLGRSQPPFLTDLVLRTYKRILDNDPNKARDFLKQGIFAAIKEYHQVWTSEPRLDPKTGLSRYRPTRYGIPPEVEPGHFDWVLEKFAAKHGMTVRQLDDAYNSGKIQDSEMDDFFLHDAAVRESGHDTSYRVEGQAADLATIDLACLLYKYEKDIEWAIQEVFGGTLDVPSDCGPTASRTPQYWNHKAASRQASVNKYCWNPEEGMYHDYNTAKQRQTQYESVTTFWALWSGIASEEQAKSLMQKALPKFEYQGGVVSTTRQPREPHGKGPPIRQRQWDFPFGWAPHQMMLWDGLQQYGYHDVAKRLAYRWLYLLTRIAVDYNGMITERYDVTSFELGTKEVVEYGNQGCDFRGVASEGFGWSNASYTYGLTIIGPELVNALKKGLRCEEALNTVG
ncbi:hypothetical protein AC578_6604 [Pseudocercospora eumusae]|uniref:Trehalase n=1 Tax=Pseudocercospora eumusae TaxID=321146 RepID=A0A139GYF0_9PEZI|nr:hypothetical protein AC578_6604 [Pseudocercospora eumusae]